MIRLTFSTDGKKETANEPDMHEVRCDFSDTNTRVWAVRATTSDSARALNP